MARSQEYLIRELIHHLSDTISLLGGGEHLVTKLRQVEEKPITTEIIEDIREYNIGRIDEVKTRLHLLNSTTVFVE